MGLETHIFAFVDVGIVSEFVDHSIEDILAACISKSRLWGFSPGWWFPIHNCVS